MERRAVGKSIYDSINFLEKKKRKIKILTNFNIIIKATIKAREIVEKKWKEKFFPSVAIGNMDANSRNYRNYNHTYRNGLFFFFFSVPR